MFRSVGIKNYCTVQRITLATWPIDFLPIINYSVYLLIQTISKPLKLRGLASRFSQNAP